MKSNMKGGEGRIRLDKRNGWEWGCGGDGKVDGCGRRMGGW